MIRPLALLFMVTIPEAAFACIGADDVKHEQFVKNDTNGDGKISYEEHYAYEQKKLDILRNDRPGPVAQFFGFGSDVNEDHYVINEPFFKIHWHNSDINKDGFWSEDEFMHQKTEQKC